MFGSFLKKVIRFINIVLSPFFNIFSIFLYFFIFDALSGTSIQRILLSTIYFFYKRKIGRNIYIARNVKFTNLKNIEFGNDVFINSFSFFDAKGKIVIGSGTWIGFSVNIITATHKIENMDHYEKSVSIGKYCWIGANVTVLPGVTIGDFSVIGAGSVVVKDIPPYSVAVGNPAKVIKKRDVTLPYYVHTYKAIEKFE
ncbi:MAG TPA: DapH/DapD/GlmU-related protein [Spirochaetota bacterium]|nr:DapH/DapD/GlmU-related protein [Spirochaetota bacterium]